VSESAPGRVVLGRVVGAHALRGEVRVRYFGDGPENLLGIDSVWIAAGSEQAQRYAVERSGTGRTGEVRLLLAGVRGRDAAEAMRGQLVLGDASELEPLAEGEFYWHELIGCRVESADAEIVGQVCEIWETGGHDLLVIERPEGGRVLVPTAREIMLEVDLTGRRIVIDAIPGLLDTTLEG
jgi:16S rRNA processing protein RimM